MSLILGANQLTAGGYEVDNSLRFNSGSSDSLTRTPASTTNRKTWTWSGWVKRSILGADQDLFNAYDSVNGFTERFYFTSGNILEYDHDIAGSDYTLNSEMLFRDVGAWYHLVVAKDTTQATEANRLKIYVNGVQITLTEVALGYPPQNTDGDINNSSYVHSIGKIASTSFYNGYMSEINFIDGQQLDPDDFGEFDSDTNIWKPIPYTGSFGTNGFYLEFQDSSALGDDTSGNGNDWTVNNLTSIDQSTDTCTNNFATMNPLNNNNASLAFTNGNLEVTSSAQWLGDTSTIGVSQGKWYWEVKYISGNFGFGIGKIGTSATATGNLSTANSGYVGKYPDGYEYFRNGANSQKINNDSSTSYGTQASANDILMVAFNADIGAIWVGRNGTWYASATQAEIEAGTTTNAMFSGITINDFFTPTGSFENGALQYNFGSPPFTISSGNADADGFGNFEYAVPSGYFALCTKNLAEYG
jgi:hypothetical protein